MSNPVIDAFFLGRALAEVVGERLEDAYTNAMSELGKFDAEQRENLRVLIEEVQLRAASQSSNSNYANTVDSPNSYSSSDEPEDLQEMLDRLRAEIASLRSELKQHQN